MKKTIMILLALCLILAAETGAQHNDRRFFTRSLEEVCTFAVAYYDISLAR